VNILSLVAFFAFIVYLFLGIYTYRLDRCSKLNRIFSLLCMDFAVWAFAYTFFYSAPDKQTAWFWYHVSSPGWCFFPALTLHFFLILTGHKAILGKWWAYPLLYLPGAMFMYKTLTGTLLVSDFVYQGFGWCEIALSGTLWFWSYVFYYSSFILAWFVLTFKWHAKAQNAREKKQAHVILTVAFPVLLGSIATDTVLPTLEIYTLPSIASVLILVWIAGIWYAMVKYKLMDITPAVAAEDIVSAMFDLLVLAGYDGTVIKLNRRTIDLVGYEESEIIGKPLETLFADKELFREKFINASQADHAAHCELDLITKHNELIPLNLSCSLIKDNFGDPVGYAIVGQDLRQMMELQTEIANRKTAEARLQYMTLFDPITGLPNRKLFFDRMSQIIENAGHNKAMCALLLVELQGTDHLNIAVTRETGGKLLKDIAAKLEKYARDSDMAARIGEEAFAIMIAGIKDSTEVQTIAGRICAALSKPFNINGNTLHMNIEVGIGIYPSDGDRIDALLRKAVKDKCPINKFLFQTDTAASYSSE
jgi:diguanylate cyclase (GGDEF)-like protein/PAS domain S-box-containing protein